MTLKLISVSNPPTRQKVEESGALPQSQKAPGAELATAPTWAQAGMMISLVPAPPPPNFSVTGHVHLVNIALSLPRCCFKTITSTTIRRCHHD